MNADIKFTIPRSPVAARISDRLVKFQGRDCSGELHLKVRVSIEHSHGRLPDVSVVATSIQVVNQNGLGPEGAALTNITDREGKGFMTPDNLRLLAAGLLEVADEMVALEKHADSYDNDAS